jgi:hypothetical protein
VRHGDDRKLGVPRLLLYGRDLADLVEGYGLAAAVGGVLDGVTEPRTLLLEKMLNLRVELYVTRGRYLFRHLYTCTRSVLAYPRMRGLRLGSGYLACPRATAGP